MGQHQTVTQHLWGHLHLQGWGGPGGGILGSDGVDLPWIGEALLLWQEYQVPTLLLLLQYTYYYSSCHYIEGINKPGVQIGTNRPGVEQEEMVTLESTATTITGWTASPGPGFLTSQTPHTFKWN